MRRKDLPIARMGAALLCLALLLCACPVRAQAAGGWENIVDVVAGNGYTAALRDDGKVLYAGRREADDPYAAENWVGVERLERSASYPFYLIGYLRDGTVRMAGSATYGRFDLAGCRQVSKLVFQDSLAAALQRDGTVRVLAARGGYDDEGTAVAAKVMQQRADQWKDIRELCFCYGEMGTMLLGLTADGTVVSTDLAWESAHKSWEHVIGLYPNYIDGVWGLRRDGTVLGMENTSDGSWTNVDSLYMSSDSYFALTRDGRVLVGDSGYRNDPRMQQVASWDQVVTLGFDANGWARFVPAALRVDGTVCVTQTKDTYQESDWDTSSWTGVKRLYSGTNYTLGLRPDGTVLATDGEFDRAPFVDKVSGWTDIAALYFSNAESVNDGHVVGLRFDGTLVAAGNNDYGQCSLR